MLTYRGKATKVNKETKKSLKNSAQLTLSYYNKLLVIALNHYDNRKELLTDKGNTSTFHTF
jgi:hypothetical protein